MTDKKQFRPRGSFIGGPGNPHEFTEAADKAAKLVLPALVEDDVVQAPTFRADDGREEEAKEVLGKEAAAEIYGVIPRVEAIMALGMPTALEIVLEVGCPLELHEHLDDHLRREVVPNLPERATMEARHAVVRSCREELLWLHETKQLHRLPNGDWGFKPDTPT